MDEKNISKKNKKIIIWLLIIITSILFIHYQANEFNYKLNYNLREMRREVKALDENITKVELRRTHGIGFRIYIYMSNIPDKDESMDLLNNVKEITLLNLEDILNQYMHLGFKPNIYIYLSDAGTRKASYLYEARYISYMVGEEGERIEVIDNYEIWDLLDYNLIRKEMEENN